MTTQPLIQRMVAAAIDYLTDSHGHPATPAMLYRGLVGDQPCEISQTTFARHLGRAAKKTHKLGFDRLKYRTPTGSVRVTQVYYRARSATSRRQLDELIRDIRDAGVEPSAPRLRPMLIATEAAPVIKKAPPLGEFSIAAPRRNDFSAGHYTPPTSLPAARPGADDHLRFKSAGLRC